MEKQKKEEQQSYQLVTCLKCKCKQMIEVWEEKNCCINCGGKKFKKDENKH